MKAGTTAFIDMIGQHSYIYVSPIKEPHYFVKSLPKSIYEPSRFFNIDTYFEKEFPKPLHIAKLESEEYYSRLFSLSTTKHAYLAEASTGYLHAPEAAKFIYEYNPFSKIIILVREPLARAFSHYKMDVAFGRTAMSFQEAIATNIEAYNEGNLSNWSYLGMSLYADNCKRYVECFGRHQVHILELKAYKEERANELNTLFKFLNIPAESLVLPSKNTGKEIRFPKLFFFLKKWGLKDYFSYLVPKKLRQEIFKNLSSEKKSEMHLDEATLTSVNSIFSIDQQNLKEYL